MRDFIRTQLPTLDAGLTGAGGWWQGRSARDRMLLGGVAVVALVLVLIYAVVKPIQGARAAALADIRTYETLTARIRAAGTLTAARPQRRTGDPASVARQSAGGFGLALSTVPLPGGVRAIVADASYESVMNWLADVTTTSDLRIRRVTIQRLAAPGRVAATVELGG